jgi:hypothetical protein
MTTSSPTSQLPAAQHRPILLNSCARAASAAEAQFRIDVPLVPSRATRVVALDTEAAEAVREVAGMPWASTRFFTVEPGHDGVSPNGSAPDDLLLRTMDGQSTVLGEELADVDAVVMVAASDEGAAAASSIGMACTLRGVMTAGLVLVDGAGVGGALTALRPYARVLMVPAEVDDLAQLLTAIRA